jgi:hypothetical protein
VIQGYCVDRIGQTYIERGDYQIVRPESDQTVDRSAFAKVVKEGNVFETSIVLKYHKNKRGMPTMLSC